MRFAAVVIAFAAHCLLSAAQDLDACMAKTMAATDPDNAIASAVASSISTTATNIIDCGSGSGANAEQVSGLAIAFSLAISESRAAADGCVAEAVAKAEDVPKIVGEAMKEAVMAGVLGEAGGAYWTMANAWFSAQGGEINNLIERRERERGSVFGSSGCVDLGKVANGLPTAVELATLIDRVVREILEALQCGVNVENNGKECYYENGKYIGLCTKPKETAFAKKRDCKGEYKNCKQNKAASKCYYDYLECRRSFAKN